MVNSTDLSDNTTTQVSLASQILRIVINTLMVPFIGIFIYFIVIILKVFLTSAQVRETARYILFIHMLLNDLVHLFISFFLFTLAINLIHVHVPLCLVITLIATSMFRITPYNLAAMSLERYAAICHPLRYAELCTVQRSILSIVYMWTVAIIPPFANVIAYCYSAEPRNFYFKVLCNWKSLYVTNVHVVISNFTDIASFSMVGLIIAYTYVKVMLVARRMDSGKNTSKAGRTVLLHAFQLLLTMLSFTTRLTETYLAPYFKYLTYINFFLVMSFPRFISPLIYGLRDEVFGKFLRKFYSAAMILPLCHKVG